MHDIPSWSRGITSAMELVTASVTNGGTLTEGQYFEWRRLQGKGATQAGYDWYHDAGQHVTQSCSRSLLLVDC